MDNKEKTTPQLISELNELRLQYKQLEEKVTEYKRETENLQESEKKFRNLVQGIPECIYNVLPDGTLQYMSPTIEIIIGYSAKEFIEDKNFWIRLILEEDKEELITKLKKSLTNGDPYIHEFRMRRKDNTIVWIRDHANVHFDDSGNIISITGIILDITDQKKLEESLQIGKEQYYAIFNGAGDGIIYTDKKGNILEANNAFFQITGVDRNEVIGKNAYDLANKFMNSKDLPDILSIVEDNLKGRTARQLEINYKDKILEVSAPLASIEKAGITAIVRDITEYKMTQKKLIESEEKYRKIIENIHNIVYSYDADGTIYFISPNVLSMTGYKTEDIIGHNIIEFVHPDDKEHVLNDFEKTLTTGKEFPTIARLVKKDGSYFYIEELGKVVRKGNKIIGITGVLRDITERKFTEEKLKLTQEELEIKAQNLEETNTALKVLLKHQDEEKKIMEKQILLMVRQKVYC